MFSNMELQVVKLLERVLERSMMVCLLGLLRTDRLAREMSAVTRVMDILKNRRPAHRSSPARRTESGAYKIFQTIKESHIPSSACALQLFKQERVPERSAPLRYIKGSNEGQSVGVGLRGRYAARRALGGARVTLGLRGLLGIQVERVNVKGHGGHVHVITKYGTDVGYNNTNRERRFSVRKEKQHLEVWVCEGGAAEETGGT
ncbi:hypothetical protein EYF80_003747 [Liparis tanakae]|uniref:Uncharacterized protein n=1 Tax=Liparis tanakae TaxID=230148 RepID=A0A4Z2J8C6_9TELE|nr:hypothetical protein EYF80_003747 [Liparis tanakae]